MRKMDILGLSLLATVFIQCNSDPSLEGCSVNAVVRDLTGFDGCGFVFELEDGSRLEPIRPQLFCGTPPLPKEITEDPLYNFNLYDGQLVTIAYKKTGKPSICMVGPVVKITCIIEVGTISEE